MYVLLFSSPLGYIIVIQTEKGNNRETQASKNVLLIPDNKKGLSFTTVTSNTEGGYVLNKKPMLNLTMVVTVVKQCPLIFTYKVFAKVGLWRFMGNPVYPKTRKPQRNLK